MTCFYISNFSGLGKDDFKYNVCFKLNKFTLQVPSSFFFIKLHALVARSGVCFSIFIIVCKARTDFELSTEKFNKGM